MSSFWPDTSWATRGQARRAAEGRPPRAAGWVDAVVSDRARPATVMGVALLAGVVEAASMLPYLGAVALLSASDLNLVSRVLVLAGYVLVMAIPAVLLLAVRMTARTWLEPRLARLSTWVQARLGGATWWVLGVLGFLLAADALSRLLRS